MDNERFAKCNNIINADNVLNDEVRRARKGNQRGVLVVGEGAATFV